MKILIIYSSKKYRYHKTIANEMESILLKMNMSHDTEVSVELYDLSDDTPMASHYNQIQSKQAEIIIVYDMVGFDFLTSGDTLAYNGLSSRFINILFKDSDKYKNELKFRQNLSMFTYVNSNEDIESFKHKYSSIPNVYRFTDIDYDELTDNKENKSRDTLKEWCNNEIRKIMEYDFEDEKNSVLASKKEDEVNALIFEWGLGSLSYEDIRRAFDALEIKYDTVSYQFEDVNKDDFFKDIFKRKINSGRYDFIYSTNYFPLVAECANELGIPYISWSYDAPLDVPNIERTLGLDSNYVFLYDRQQANSYINKGFSNVYHLPLAVNTKRLDKIVLTKRDKELYSSDISFVGKLYESQLPMILSWLNEYHRGYIEAIVKAQLKIYGYYLVDDILSDGFISEINADVLANTGSSINVSKEALSYAIASQITREERLLILKLLSNHYDVKLYSTENNDLLDKIKLMGTVGYLNDMPKVFKSSKINLNISLKCIQSGIPLRVLDIMGAGGFVISNYQPEIAEFFNDGEDLVMYESIEDLYSKVDFYLKNDELRNRIAINGHEKVEQYFKYEDRLRTMLEVAGIAI